MTRIRSAARRNSIYVVLGYSEIDLATCYLAQIIIAPSGTVLSHRRKIKPTHVERLIFGEGTGDSLDSVVQTDIGRLGCFNCWENLNPLLKAHSAALGEQVHVAAWYSSSSFLLFRTYNPWQAALPTRDHTKRVRPIYQRSRPTSGYYHAFLRHRNCDLGLSTLPDCVR
jgi:predicted amidohydrolase